MQEIIIKMNDTIRDADNEPCAHVTIVDEVGAKQSRYVTWESLVAAICESVEDQREYIAVGEIPFGYYDARVGKEQGAFCADLIAVLPSGHQMMRYEETMYDICTPGIVFCFAVRKGRIVNTRVYAINDERPSSRTKLYRYPFGNVGENGIVCWGANRLPCIQALKDLEEAMLLFIQSPTNSDHFRGKEQCGHEDLTLRELFEYLKDQETYPDEYLVATKNGRKHRYLGELTPWKTKKSNKQ